MPLFGCSTLSQSRIEQSRSELVMSVTPILTQATSNSHSTAIDNASDSAGQSFQEASSRPQTTQKQTVDAPSSSHPQVMTSPSTPPSSPFASPPITLIVGGPSSPSPQTPQTTFYVHADLLTRVSLFFRAAFDNHKSQAGFLEASTLIMRLPEQRPEDMAYLVQWLYHPKGSLTAQSLYHDLVDVPLGNVERYKRERALVQHAERNGDVTQLVAERPGPPAFGPLIRLWILADRLSVQGGLRGEICARVREVGERAAAVPSKDDIWRLWEGMPKLEGSGVMESGGEQEEDLKEVVLEMYANMRGWAVFEEGEESEEEYDWHPMFMRALVVRLLREKREVREAARSKEAKCKCDEVEAGRVRKDGGSVG